MIRALEGKVRAKIGPENIRPDIFLRGLLQAWSDESRWRRLLSADKERELLAAELGGIRALLSDLAPGKDAKFLANPSASDNPYSLAAKTWALKVAIFGDIPGFDSRRAKTTIVRCHNGFVTEAYNAIADALLRAWEIRDHTPSIPLMFRELAEGLAGALAKARKTYEEAKHWLPATANGKCPYLAALEMVESLNDAMSNVMLAKSSDIPPEFAAVYIARTVPFGDVNEMLRAMLRPIQEAIEKQNEKYRAKAERQDRARAERRGRTVPEVPANADGTASVKAGDSPTTGQEAGKPASPATTGNTNGEDRVSVQWISLADAEKLSGINRGVISKAAKADEIKSNGETGKGKIKIDSADFNRWHLERAKRPEQAESDEEVKRLFQNDAD